MNDKRDEGRVSSGQGGVSGDECQQTRDFPSTPDPRPSVTFRCQGSGFSEWEISPNRNPKPEARNLQQETQNHVSIRVAQV